MKGTQRKLSVALWTAQALLAALFLMTGSIKLLMPAEMLAAQTPLPIEVVRFIGMCEVAGALGLLLPGLLRIGLRSHRWRQQLSGRSRRSSPADAVLSYWPRVATLPTAIVLAVVQCGDRICVGRRSRRVATARGLWSVVTGYLEPQVEPLAQALDEIREELGLSPPGLALVCDMEPVPLSSPSSGKRFLVYPFLFECSGTDQVVLNWEHDEFDWVDPSRLESADCVQWQPPLVRALLASRGSARRQ